MDTKVGLNRNINLRGCKEEEEKKSADVRVKKLLVLGIFFPYFRFQKYFIENSYRKMGTECLCTPSHLVLLQYYLQNQVLPLEQVATNGHFQVDRFFSRPFGHHLVGCAHEKKVSEPDTNIVNKSLVHHG